MFKNSSHCYTFKKIKYNKGLLDNAVDATYIIHLEGNGRYDDIMNQLESYHPTKEIYIIFNKGYKKCSKDDRIILPAYDLVDAFLQVFKHAKNQNYNNILILEDDFMFNEKIKKESIRNDICSFLNNNKDKDYQYFLGCLPSLWFPYTIDLKHFINICSTGTHAVIYTKKNRERLLNVNQKDITDWDCFSFTHSRRYMYCEPLCYQLFPDTENSKYWGTHSYFTYIVSQIGKKILKIFRLDTEAEPGYSFFYTFSTLFTFILLILILVIVYKISITLFKRKIKVSKKK
jgi:GR25 family glycosyltransferase involved in LPS biosynthesis